MHTLTKQDVRRLALHKQGLYHTPTAATPEAALQIVEQLGCVQLDTLNVVPVTRSQHLIFWSRTADFRIEWFHQFYEQQQLFEHYLHALSVLPMQEHVYMQPFLHRYQASRVERTALHDQLLAAIEQHGTLTGQGAAVILELPKTPKGTWQLSPVRRALDELWRSGEIGVLRDAKFHKVYCRLEDQVPEHLCLDCHVNGHTTGQFHLNPDNRPQHRRLRLDTVSLRGLFNQQIHGSKRSLRSVEDFTEFEQRTAYFNGDPIHAMKKGMNILDRIPVSHMAQMQNMFDFPPAPKLDPTGRLRENLATKSELRGEKVFFGKGRCAECHPAPSFLDHQMHDLYTERFVNEAPVGPIKTFTLRGIKDSPPYMHDGRCLTLEDTVEFFNIVLQLKLTAQEKTDLTAYMRQL